MVLAVVGTLGKARAFQASALPAVGASSETGANAFPARELVVGTKEAPPFAMKDPQGKWTGISIDLWQQMAEKLGIRFRFVGEPSVQSLIDATARGTYDVSIAAITITPD